MWWNLKFRLCRTGRKIDREVDEMVAKELAAYREHPVDLVCPRCNRRLPIYVLIRWKDGTYYCLSDYITVSMQDEMDKEMEEEAIESAEDLDELLPGYSKAFKQALDNTKSDRDDITSP